MALRPLLDLGRHSCRYSCPLLLGHDLRPHGSAAELAEARKEAKYMQLMQSYHFVPLAFETMGPINTKGQALLADLGRLLGQISGDPREASFLFQHLL